MGEEKLLLTRLLRAVGGVKREGHDAEREGPFSTRPRQRVPAARPRPWLPAAGVTRQTLVQSSTVLLLTLCGYLILGCSSCSIK
jgi:hypothetical protein